MAVEVFSWPSLHERMCRTWGSNSGPLAYGSWSEGPVILPYILKTFWYMSTILQDYESVWHNIWTQNKCRSLWPIFHGPVILPCILKTIWYKNTILWDYESVWPDVWPQNKCGSLWPIFHGPVILPYILKTICYMNTILWDYESVWPDAWPLNIYRSLWPIFHGPVILPYILNVFDGWMSYFWKMYLWPQNKFRSQWPIYFTFQWFFVFYFLLWKTFKFYWQSSIQASYAVLWQLLLKFICMRVFLAHLSRRLICWAYRICRLPSYIGVHTL